MYTIYTQYYLYMLLSRKKERKKERHLRQWKNEKMTVASGGIPTHVYMATFTSVCTHIDPLVVHVHIYSANRFIYSIYIIIRI